MFGSRDKVRHRLLAFKHVPPDPPTHPPTHPPNQTKPNQSTQRFVCMGPSAGFGSHYGHFDPLVGKRASSEVFPLIADFLEHHDTRVPVSKM
jgi:hypothetical protein